MKILNILSLALLVWESHQYCAPDCSGADPGTSVRDPTDCTRYYVCLSIDGEMVPSEAPLDCPTDQYFNDEYTVPRCDNIGGALPGFCSPLCNPCVADCNEGNPGTVQPHPENCRKYYVCLANGLTLEQDCPPSTPYFDFRTGLCQGDATLCYHYCDPCVVHCTDQGELLPDPTDCTHFFLCTPPTVAPFTCPHDEVFNPETFQCEVGAPCQVACPATTTSTSTTTTTTPTTIHTSSAYFTTTTYYPSTTTPLPTTTVGQ